MVWFGGVVWWGGLVGWFGGVVWWGGLVVWFGGVVWWCGLVVFFLSGADPCFTMATAFVFYSNYSKPKKSKNGVYAWE